MWLIATGNVPCNLPFRLETGRFLVGRGRTANISIVDRTVSRRHAWLMRSKTGLAVQDLESSNGTFVNDCRTTRCLLRLGDQLRFGRVLCIVSPSPVLVECAADDEPTLPMPIDGNTATERFDVLTPAQQQVVKHILAGCREAEIAKSLRKSRHTIHEHFKAVFRKLGVHSRVELMALFLKRRRDP